MNANKLMLGNYVNYVGITTRVNSISGTDKFYVATFASGVFHESNYTPIPLTEKWLLDFGFVKDNLDNTFYKDNFEILLPSFFKYKDSILNRLKYVHQLQNLYFALTGEDLVVSDSVS